MGRIIAFGGKKPKIHVSAYIDPTAVIIGDVTIMENVSVWPLSVIRADEEKITIGNDSAILDHVLIEAPKNNPVEIGEKVIVSHCAALHGCKVGDRSLIGVGSIVLDGAIIESECIIGAGAVVPPHTKVPKRALMLGVPAKQVREVSEKEIKMIINEIIKIQRKAKKYVQKI